MFVYGLMGCGFELSLKFTGGFLIFASSTNGSDN